MAVSVQKREELRRRMKALGIAERDLEEKFTRGSGKGGQKVNKTNNCVCLTHVPSGIVVKCHRERERETNRFLARRALCDELEHRLYGTPSALRMEQLRAHKHRRSTASRRNLHLDFRAQKSPSPPNADCGDQEQIHPCQ